MTRPNLLVPNINEGRYFISPILGCTGACSYCYLPLKNYSIPCKNELIIDEIKLIAQQSKNFVFGQMGTIISVGAWGDIFPLQNDDLIQYSVQVIRELLKWGNPVQIMSKNVLNRDHIKELADNIVYPGQLLYSTTLTTINQWRSIEPGTANPINRLETCQMFHLMGIPTNVLLKPFIFGLTDVDLQIISDLLLQHQIDYCTLGVMYISTDISKKIRKNKILSDIIELQTFCSKGHLDCNGETPMLSTTTTKLLPVASYLKSKGIFALLKFSCVNANVLHMINPSNYFELHNQYCIHCGNCSTTLENLD